MTITTSSPGKLMIMGEYGVLFGGQALITCTKQQAICSFTKSPTMEFFSSPFMAEGISHPLFMATQEACKNYDVEVSVGEYALDTKDFFYGSRKIGLGSSAAAITSLVKAMLLAKNIDSRNLLLDIALFAHKIFAQGFGSGADVAASVYAESITFKNDGGLNIATHHPWFIDELVFIDTGHSQNTTTFVKEVMVMAKSDPSLISTCSRDLSLLCEKAMQAPDIDAIIDLIGQHYQCLARLGRRVGIDIISDEHRRIHNAATLCHGSAKPCGSGGGDVAMALIPKAHRKLFHKTITELGFLVISV